MVCSFQSDHPVVTNYSFGKTLAGKKAEREISLQLSPGALSEGRSDRSRARVERRGQREATGAGCQ